MLSKKLLFFFLIFIIFIQINSGKQVNIKAKEGYINPKEALFYKKMENKEVKCFLCPRECVIKEGDWGFCRARKNIKGTLYSMGYGAPCSVHVDPIEKKPFLHFYPGTKAFSIASAGCNLRCKYCQNWEISQTKPTETINLNLDPEYIPQIVINKEVKSIAYTYSEPTNFYEYMLDTAMLAKKHGIKNVVHSSGYINPEPLKKLTNYIDAFCIDLKGFTELYYRNICGADLQPVLNSLKVIKKNGVWLELVNLIIPTKNDDPKQIKKMCVWIKNNLGKSTPISFSKYYPTHKLTNIPPTPLKTLEKAVKIARDVGLEYVYIGNVPGHKYEDTYCPECGVKLIDRYGYHIIFNKIKNGRCPNCNEKIEGVWNEK